MYIYIYIYIIIIGLARRTDAQASKPTRGELAEVAEALAQLDYYS